MSKQFPVRSASHQLEEASERVFRNSLPRDWTCERSQHDYGIDLRVDLFDDGRATGLELLVQLKSSEEPSGEVVETVRLRTATYNYLWAKLQVVMLVKYVEKAGEAYWLWLRDVVKPPADQKSFTLQIPKTNRLSTIDWAAVMAYAQRVTDIKTAAMRREALRADAY